jgi:hypothetical protein
MLKRIAPSFVSRLNEEQLNDFWMLTGESMMEAHAIAKAKASSSANSGVCRQLWADEDALPPTSGITVEKFLALAFGEDERPAVAPKATRRSSRKRTRD